MNKQNYEVLAKIIGAVETGGQVYGNSRYDNYTAPYTNSSLEVTVTLGWAQFYGAEAKALIQKIYDTDPDAFKAIDSKGVIAKKLQTDWVALKWNPTASQKKLLIALISSDIGKKCQDELFAEQMESYVADCEKTYTSDVPAVMMYCEIRHLAGKSGVDRIFKRCTQPYSLENIMASLKRDQSDTSSNNQAGDTKYWSRHEKCVEFIKKYAVDENAAISEESRYVTASDIVTRANHYIGYEEKKSNNSLESFHENTGSNNYQKFQPLAGAGNGDQWCQYFVDGVAVEVCGSIVAAEKLLYQPQKSYMTGYTPDGAGYFKSAGRWYTTPEVGDVVYFYGHPTDGGYRICHTGYVVAVDKEKKTFQSTEGNTSSSEFTTNGGCVAHHTYSYESVGGTNRVNGFGRPNYGAVEKSGDTSVDTADSFNADIAGKYTTTTALNLRCGAGTLNAVEAVIPSGGYVQNYGYYTKDWYLVQYGELTGFVSSKYLKKVQTGTVTTPLNLRTGAGIGNRVLTVLKKGTGVTILGTVEDSKGAKWYRVEAGGRSGYVSAGFVEI